MQTQTTTPSQLPLFPLSPLSPLPDVDAPTLQSSAMILRIHITTYTGRKVDKKTKEEVLLDKGAKTRAAASVYKSLFAGDDDLEAIVSFASKARRDIAFITNPWSDNGDRLVSTRNYFEVTAQLASLRQEFYVLVNRFRDNYAVKVGNAAFALGDLFARDEYPMPDEIISKFSFSYSFEPVPSSNDFRVDLQNEAVETLRSHYQKTAQARLQAAMDDVWGRVIDEVTRLRDKLIQPEEGRRPRIFASTLDGFKDLVGSLHALNITDDPKLEDVRVQLKNVLEPIDIDSIRESDDVRETVKENMQRVLDKFAM